MNILELTTKLEKGKELGAKEVYIKEDNVVYGIDSVFKDGKREIITILRSEKETIKVKDFISVLKNIYDNSGDKSVLVSSNEVQTSGVSDIKVLEFMQHENDKMLFINI